MTDRSKRYIQINLNANYDKNTWIFTKTVIKL